MFIKSPTSAKQFIFLSILLFLILLGISGYSQAPTQAVGFQTGFDSNTNEYLFEELTRSEPQPDKLLMIVSESGYVPEIPIDGQVYTPGQSFGSGKVLFDHTVDKSKGADFIRVPESDLGPGTLYYLTLYPYNTSSGNQYYTADPFQLRRVTPGAVPEEPVDQPTGFTYEIGEEVNGERTITFSFLNDATKTETAHLLTDYLVFLKEDAPLTAIPQDGIGYATSYGNSFDPAFKFNDGTKQLLLEGSENTGGILFNHTISTSVSELELKVYAANWVRSPGGYFWTPSSGRESFNYLLTSPPSLSIDVASETNIAPEVNNGAFSIDENAELGAIVGDVSFTDPDAEVMPIIEIISGNIDEAFEIRYEEVERSIRVNNTDALDFETNPVFDLEIRVTDEFGASDSGSYTITLNDLSEGPVIEAQTFSIISSIEEGDEVGIVEASEPDELPLTYSILSGNDQNTFSLDENTGVLTLADREALDFSNATTFELEVSVNNGTESSEAIISIVENLAPVFDWESTTFAYDENSEWYLLIPISDPEDDQLTLTIASGNTDGVLRLQNNGGIFASSAFWEVFPDDPSAGIDYESYSSFELVINAADAAGNSVDSEPITININNLNDNNPAIEDVTVSLLEGSAVGTVVTMLQADDADEDELLFSILSGNSEGAFEISEDADELLVADAAPLVFATNPSFSLEIQVTDGTNFAQATYTINLEEVTSPVIEDQSFTIIETIENGDEVGTIEAVDPKGEGLTFTISEGNEAGLFALSSSGVLSIADRASIVFMAGTTYDLNVSVSDGSESAEATISIVANLPPVFELESQEFSFDENAEWYLLLPISDPEEDELVLTIKSGNTDGVLRLENNAGIFATMDFWEVFPDDPGAGIDYETYPSFELIINAEDAEGNIVESAPIIININNLNDNAPEADDQTISINQNLPNGIKVAIVEATDADGDEAIVFEITDGNTSEAFGIDSNTGELTVTNTEALVFDTNPTFNLEITISDGELSSTAEITINLNEEAVNTPPIIEDQSFSIEENSADGTEVGLVEAVDLEGDDLTFTIVSGNSENAFLLTGSSGELIVTNSEALDFETTPIFEFLVSVTDGEFSEVATITVQLIDIEDSNTAPTIADQSFTVAENSAVGTLVGTVIASDAEEDALSYSISSGNDLDVFALDGSSGEITVVNSEVLDFETTPSFDLVVSVADAEFTEAATVTIQLTDLDETPVLGIADEVAVAVYPNPATDYFELASSAEVVSVKLLSQSGQVLLSEKVRSDNNYPIGDLSPGIYFVEIELLDAIQNSKLIIQQR